MAMLMVLVMSIHPCRVAMLMAMVMLMTMVTECYCPLTCASYSPLTCGNGNRSGNANSCGNGDANGNGDDNAIHPVSCGTLMPRPVGG